MLLALVVAIAVSQPSPSPGVAPDADAPLFACEDQGLRPEIEALLRPVLLPMAAARRAKRHHDETYVRAFESLLESSDKNAVEAQVALMAYDVGEHYGEELLASVLGRGRRAERFVASYSACRPRVSFEKDLDGVIVLKTLYTQYREGRK